MQVFLFPLFSTLLLGISANIVAQNNTLSIIINDVRSIYVIDGDSLSLPARIKDIDTPEKNQNCYKHQKLATDCGKIAKKYLQSLLKNIAGKLRIEPIEIGYYNRILVDVYKGEANIGELMVANGMAYAYGERYKQQEIIAKRQKKGFWGYASPPIQPKIWRKKQNIGF